MAPTTSNPGESSSKKGSSDKVSEKNKRPLRPEQQIDPTTGLAMNQIYKIGILVSALFQASLAYLVFNDKIQLHGKVTAESLKNFPDRIEFMLRYQALNVFWLLLTTFFVIAGRKSTGALNPLENMENSITAQKNVHQNSIEQFLMTFTNQLILATTLAPNTFLHVIPFMNALFFLGRIFFWLGYPKYRTVGFLSNLVPVVAATFYNVYALFKFIM